MHPNFDFEPAAALEAVVGAIADDQLSASTPCTDTSVRDLLAHVIGLTEAFRQTATKEAVGRSVPPAVGPDGAMPADWRYRIPAQLKALVAAWREPAAWDGETEAGGVSAPAVVMATIALDEIVVHSWDLARATDQQLAVDPVHLTVLLESPDLVHDFAKMPAEAARVAAAAAVRAAVSSIGSPLARRR